MTDGACENDDHGILATCGAVLFDKEDSSRHLFGIKVEGPLLTKCLSEGNTQVVTEMEPLPVPLAKRTWASRLKGCKVIVFLDSEPAKHLCVAGASRVPSCDAIARAIYVEEARLGSFLPMVREDYLREQPYGCPFQTQSR